MFALTLTLAHCHLHTAALIAAAPLAVVLAAGAVSYGLIVHDRVIRPAAILLIVSASVALLVST